MEVIVHEEPKRTIRITTQNAYDDRNQEYYKLPGGLVQSLFTNVSREYNIYEFELTSTAQAGTFFIELDRSLLKKIVCNRNKYVVFDEIRSNVYDDDVALDKYYVITRNLTALIERIGVTCSRLRTFKEVKYALRKEGEAIVSIFDSTDIYIEYNDQHIAELALNGMQEYSSERKKNLRH